MKQLLFSDFHSYRVYKLEFVALLTDSSYIALVVFVCKNNYFILLFLSPCDAHSPDEPATRFRFILLDFHSFTFYLPEHSFGELFPKRFNLLFERTRVRPQKRFLDPEARLEIFFDSKSTENLWD